jgi:hypothetical protein
VHGGDEGGFLRIGQSGNPPTTAETNGDEHSAERQLARTFVTHCGPSRDEFSFKQFHLLPS